MRYHLIGIVSSAIFLLCLAGVGTQLTEIVRRRRAGGARGSATRVISLNQLASSLMAFLAVLIYGFCLERFDHYLVWTRLAAVVVVLAILVEIARDRGDAESRAVAIGCGAALAAALAAMATALPVDAGARATAQWLVVGSSALVVQGFARQIVAIRRSGDTGAIALRMHQFTFAKDVMTMLFGAALGIEAGWPLVLTNGVCAAAKLGVMWHFRWVRTSPLAIARRTAASHDEACPALPVVVHS